MEAEHPLFRKKALEKLQSPEQLNQLLTVTSPKGWLSLAALGVLLLAAMLWGIVGTIQASVSGTGTLVASTEDANYLEAVLYVTLEDGRRIQQDMITKISPATARKEQYGLLWGRVLSVGVRPSTLAEMQSILGNDSYAQSLAAAGNLIEVRVHLLQDPETPSGYKWTSAVGPPTTLQANTLCTGTVVIEQQRPIELVFSDIQALFSD